MYCSCLPYSQVLGIWDLTCMIALVFVALVTPFEVAFLGSPKSAADLALRFGEVGWLWCVNRLVDLIFLVDLVLQFRLVYQTSDASSGTRWVTEPSEIIKHCKGPPLPSSFCAAWRPFCAQRHLDTHVHACESWNPADCDPCISSAALQTCMAGFFSMQLLSSSAYLTLSPSPLVALVTTFSLCARCA